MDIAVSMPAHVVLLPDFHWSIDAASKEKRPPMIDSTRSVAKPCLAFRTLPLLRRGSRRHAEVCKSFSSNASPHHLMREPKPNRRTKWRHSLQQSPKSKMAHLLPYMSRCGKIKSLSVPAMCAKHRRAAVIWYLSLRAASPEFWTQDVRLCQTRSFRLAILILTSRASHLRRRENIHRVHTVI